jgi:hypothetical protein
MQLGVLQLVLFFVNYELTAIVLRPGLEYLCEVVVLVKEFLYLQSIVSASGYSARYRYIERMAQLTFSTSSVLEQPSLSFPSE